MYKNQILETIHQLKKPHEKIIQQYKKVNVNDITYCKEINLLMKAVNALKVYESIERKLLIK